MNRVLRGWVSFFGGLALLVIFFVLIHLASPSAPGTAGEIFRRNVDKDVEAGATFYTELGSVKAFLDDENGKYGLSLLKTRSSK